MRRVLLALALFLAGCASAVEIPPQPVAVKPDRLFEDVRILSADDMEGRLVDTPGSARARAYLIRRLEAIGVEPARKTFEQEFVFTKGAQAHDGVNLIGKIEGTSRSRKSLVVMAHYDHVGVIDGQIYNGADDNASGVAALLAIAESFAADPPRHDVILALVDAEEGGMRGSRVLVSDPPVPLSDIALVVNFDMLSRNDRNELYTAGAAHFPWLKPRLEALAARAPVTLKLGHDTPAWGPNQDWTMESDHGAFHEKGVPWVYFGVEDPPDYHRPTDDFATIPQDFFRRSAQTVLEAVRAFEADLDAIAKEAGR
jgi:Zn-dependent M28 family amino/carboxypeptidase